MQKISPKFSGRFLFDFGKIPLYNKRGDFMSVTEELMLMKDEKYKEFHSKLMPNIAKEKIIGIRVPKLRSFAKNLTDYEEFLKLLPHTYYEENNLHAFLIEREKNFDRCIEKLNAFLPYVDNWATCDCMKPKVLKKEPKKLMNHIEIWLNSKDVYTVRYGINLLMSFYLDENFEEKYLKTVANVSSKEYYINMMRAWFFATALAKQYEKTLPYMENKTLDKWTHNKSIQKAVESRRIVSEHKEYLKTLKR